MELTCIFGSTAIRVAAALIVIAIVYLTRRFVFWKRHGFPCAEGSDSVLGGLLVFLRQKKSMGEYLAGVYSEAKSRHLRHIGAFLFTNPVYVPTDPEIIRCILTTDFNNFMNHGRYFDANNDPLSAHLFNVEDENWKALRSKLSPTFTPAQIKMMFPTLAECGEKFRRHVRTFSSDRAIDIKGTLARLTTDIIGSCAFGIECNSLEDPDAEFRKYGKMAFEVDFIEHLRRFAMMGLPRRLLKLLRFPVLKRDVSRFFMKVVKDMVDYRDKNGVYRKDFMQLLIKLECDKVITLNELAAQAVIFYFGGFETSSTVMTFALYEMALHQHIQDKVREEIELVLRKHDGEITYEAVSEMYYMHQVIEESMRKYPPAPFLERICKNPYRIPGSDLQLPKSTKVIISVLGIHHDPEYYQHPDIFDPERFSEENKIKRRQFTYLPFGDGPRNCIGWRFGLLQAKVALTSLLSDCRVRLHEKTPVPLELNKGGFVTTAKSGVWLKVERISIQL